MIHLMFSNERVCNHKSRTNNVIFVIIGNTVVDDSVAMRRLSRWFSVRSQKGSTETEKATVDYRDV